MKKEMKELKLSMAVELVDGYFYNFVKAIAINIRDADGRVELTYNRNKVEVREEKNEANLNHHSEEFDVEK